MELDVIGQYYTSIISVKQTGVFALIVRLKENVNPQALQQAANDLMRRLPFMNGRVRQGFFHYKYELLDTPAEVAPDEEPLFCDYYNKYSRRMIRIVYGRSHFTVKVTHSCCDGRGLSKFTSALIVRYFELLGVEADKGDIIDCSEAFQADEAEDAIKRYAAPAAKAETSPIVKAYHPEYSKSAPQEVITICLDAAEIKAAAKAQDATVTEYILAHIFKAAAGERAAKEDNRPIAAMIPIDCRSFFPSRTLRSFVSAETIIMPEETESFSALIKQIKAQFNKINKESVQNQLYEYHKMYQSARYVPRAVKALFMKAMTYFEASGVTTGFSNLGIIKLPREIESRIEHMEFPISLEQDTPYFFSCVTIGNNLALTAVFRGEGRRMVESVRELLGDVAKDLGEGDF